VKKKLDVKKLSEPQVQDALKNALASNLPADPQAHDDLETAWPSFRHATLLSLCLVTPRKKHQDWFGESNQKILGFLAEKRAAHAAWLSDKD